MTSQIDRIEIRLELGGKKYACHAANGVSIAIPMEFSGPQPNHFGAPLASSVALELDGFVGDTNQDGSCNVDVLTIVPHCNGTHTESVGHIVNEDVFVGSSVAESLTIAVLITVTPRTWSEVNDSNDSYRPPLNDADLVICHAEIERAIRALDFSKTTSLIVRTTGELEKNSVAYGHEHRPPFLTVQAMEFIVDSGFRHLLIDIPSVDRMFDEGLLTNHHIFWCVEEGANELSAKSRKDKTITEMILVPDELPDGVYLLNLQIPALCTDAAPSQPVVFRAIPNG